MISGHALSQLLSTLYAAPTSPELWQDFLRDLTSALKLTGAAIMHQDLQKQNYDVQYSFGGDPEWGSLYREYYGKLDVWRAGFLPKEEGDFVFGDELCAPSKAKTTEFYNEFLAKYDIRLFGAVATVKRPKQVEHISLYQSWKGKGPGQHAADAMNLIFPHLQRALDLR